MNIITPGHRYELPNFESPENGGQIIQFIHKEPVDAGAGSTVLETINDGTTNEALLEVLIDRMGFYNQSSHAVKMQSSLLSWKNV